MSKTVVVDSDSIFALYNPQDPHNEQATATLTEMAKQGFQIVYPSSVLFEVVSLFQRVLPTPTVTNHLIDLIKNDMLVVHTVEIEELKKAAQMFNSQGSKYDTLVDCSVVVIAKTINADGVFGYDGFYKKHGLKSAEELL